MHTFSDASEFAFSAAVYFRIIFSNDIEVVLVTSKSKVAPNKVLSVPKLELQAALLGSRLANTVQHEHRLKINAKYYWTDSKTVLSWILKSDPQNLKSFVSIRIGEILDLTNPHEWRKVPTLLNVADDATKWNDNSTYSAMDRWFTGPEFLRDPPKCWPQMDYNKLPEPEDAKHAVYVISELEISFNAVPIYNYSNYARLVRVMAYVCKFLNSCRTKRNQIEKLNCLEKIKRSKIKTFHLNINEIQQSENMLIRYAQFDCFKEEFIALVNGQEILKKSNLLPLSPTVLHYW
jgi:hypothetical protein